MIGLLLCTVLAGLNAVVYLATENPVSAFAALFCALMGILCAVLEGLQ